MAGDIRYALRQLARAPSFSMAAIATLALGIGANTAIFSLAHAVLLRPLPYAYSDRLVMVWDELQKIGVRQLPLSANTFDAYRSDARIFEAAEVFKEEDRNLTGGGVAERISVTLSTPGLLEMLGARVRFGRLINSTDGQPANPDGAVLSHSLFMRRFGGNPDVLGQTIRLDDRAYTVMGILAPEFRFGLRPGGGDVWIPLPPVDDRGRWQFRMLARLKSGVGLATAQSSVTAAARHVEETLHPYRGPNGEDAGYRAVVVSLRSQLLGEFRTGTLVLFGAVSLVLLIACVNVANLLLARAADRQRETCVRLALGASQIRLLRQRLTEAGVLALVGGAAGLLVSGWGIALLEGLSPVKLPEIARPDIDGRALAFNFTVSAVVALLASLAPAIFAGRLNRALRGPQPQSRTSSVLVATEVALATVLAIGAGLLLGSFARLRQIDPGFRPDHLLTMRVQLSGPRYEQALNRIEFFTTLREGLASLHGVTAVSMVSMLPVQLPVGSLQGRGGNPFSIAGRRWNPAGAVPQIAHTRTVGLDYFKTLGIPLRVGRAFIQSDSGDAPAVAVINETLARGFFPRGDAIGQRIMIGAPTPDARWMTIVGIVADAKSGSLDQPLIPQFYMPVAQDAARSMTLVLRTSQENPLTVAGEVAAVIRRLDPEQPVSNVASMEQHIESTMGHPRLQTVLLAFFAATALFLAAVGIYRMVAQATARRTHEIGIRMALGADAKRLVRTLVGEGLRPVLAGAAAGVIVASFGSRILSTVLFEIEPHDPPTFVIAAALVTGIATLACLGPARRAARVDPVAALREE
jgi:putative ABC transport system permease protein